MLRNASSPSFHSVESLTFSFNKLNSNVRSGDGRTTPTELRSSALLFVVLATFHSSITHPRQQVDSSSLSPHSMLGWGRLRLPHTPST